MKIHRENEFLFSIRFTHYELCDMEAVAKASGESVEDCLTAFFSGCLSKFNDVQERKDGDDELAR